MKSNIHDKGFTIVELLIVIVVIGVLASIVVVAYNGVQNRANDAAVQSDLTNAAQEIEIMKLDNGEYSSGGTMSTAPNSFTNINVTKGSYTATSGNNNFIYCATTDKTNYGLAALSKSGNAYMYTPNGGLQSYSASWTSLSTDTCPNLVGVDYTFSWGYGKTDGWKTWATPNP